VIFQVQPIATGSCVARGVSVGRLAGGSAGSMRSTSTWCEAGSWRPRPGWRITWRGCASLAFWG